MESFKNDLNVGKEEGSGLEKFIEEIREIKAREESLPEAEKKTAHFELVIPEELTKDDLWNYRRLLSLKKEVEQNSENPNQEFDALKEIENFSLGLGDYYRNLTEERESSRAFTRYLRNMLTALMGEEELRQME